MTVIRPNAGIDYQVFDPTKPPAGTVADRQFKYPGGQGGVASPGEPPNEPPPGPKTQVTVNPPGGGVF